MIQIKELLLRTLGAVGGPTGGMFYDNPNTDDSGYDNKEDGAVGGKPDGHLDAFDMSKYKGKANSLGSFILKGSFECKILRFSTH